MNLKELFSGIFSEHPMKVIDIKLIGCDKQSLRIYENLFYFILFNFCVQNP